MRRIFWVLAAAVLVSATAYAIGRRDVAVVSLTTPADQSTVVDVSARMVDKPLESFSAWTSGNGSTPLNLILASDFKDTRWGAVSTHLDTLPIKEGESYNLEIDVDTIRIGASAPACDIKIILIGRKAK